MLYHALTAEGWSPVTMDLTPLPLHRPPPPLPSVSHHSVVCVSEFGVFFVHCIPFYIPHASEASPLSSFPVWLAAPSTALSGPPAVAGPEHVTSSHRARPSPAFRGGRGPLPCLITLGTEQKPGNQRSRSLIFSSSILAFGVGEDAEGHAICKSHENDEYDEDNIWQND